MIDADQLREDLWAAFGPLPFTLNDAYKVLENLVAHTQQTAPEPQLWLCRDVAGYYIIPASSRPRLVAWDDGHSRWMSDGAGPRTWIQCEVPPETEKMFNLLPGQAVALHTGRVMGADSGE